MVRRGRLERIFSPTTASAIVETVEATKSASAKPTGHPTSELRKQVGKVVGVHATHTTHTAHTTVLRVILAQIVSLSPLGV